MVSKGRCPRGRQPVSSSTKNRYSERGFASLFAVAAVGRVLGS